MRYRLIAVVFGLCAFGMCSAAPKAKPSELRTAEAYSLEPFPINAVQLPKGFRGHDLASVIGALKPAPARGEFEKSEDYESRVAEWRLRPYMGSIKPSDPLAIEVRAGEAWSDVRLRYSADDGEFRANVSSLPGHLFGMDGRWVMIADGLTDTGDRRGVNAAGVRVTVSSASGWQSGLAILNGFKEGQIRVAYPIDKAPGVKGGLVVFAVLVPSDPYTKTERVYTSATVTRPHQTDITYRALFGNLRSLLLVNRESGEILGREDY